MIVSDITTSHWEISFWSAWEIIWVWMFWAFHHFIAKNNIDNPSNMIDIQIKIHTKFAIAAEETAVNIANKTNIHPSVDIHHHKGKVSLFWIPKNINIHHLTKAHKANIQIISLPTKFASLAHASINQRIIPKIHITNRKDT